MMVSIIIPVYNVAPYIEDCLQSVMRQTYQGYMECLLVDDCGTDDSIAIAERFITCTKDEGRRTKDERRRTKDEGRKTKDEGRGTKDEGPETKDEGRRTKDGRGGRIRFRTLHHERNRGLSAARNTGMEAAVGDYVYFLDSDDEITDDCISLLMAEAERYPEVEMVQGKELSLPIRYSDSMTVKVKQRVTEAMTNDEVRRCFFELNQMKIMAWNKLLKRKFLVEHDISFEEGVLFEDIPWSFQLLKYLERVRFVESVTYLFKRREGSIQTGTSERVKLESLLRDYHQVLTELTPGREREEIGYYGKEAARLCVRYARMMPKWREDIKAWQEKARESHCGIGLRMRLAACELLSWTRYGWRVLAVVNRLEHPRLILVDVSNILRKLRNKMVRK